MGNIILFIMTMAVIVLMLYFIYKAFDKSSNMVERISYVVLAIIDVTLFGIYYLDKFNIPTELGWNKNVNTQNWLNFLGTYITGIISAGIGAVVSVFITIYQIRKNNEDNEKRDSENLRIQNMPMLKYEIETTNAENKKIDIEELIISNCDHNVSIPYNLFVTIKNIGLNNVKRIIVDFESAIVKNKERILGKNNIIPMEKNESKNLYTYFALETGKEYLIKLNVYYEDVLQNWYYQTVDIYYNASKVHNGTYPIGIIHYQINEETSIDVNEVPKEK